MDPYLLPCQPDDLHTLRALSIETFTHAFADANDPDDFRAYLGTAFSQEQMAEELARQGTQFHFLYIGSSLAGYIKLNTNGAQTEMQEPSGMELERIYVREPYQGGGLGSWLVNRVVQMARDAGKTYVWLGVWEKNTKAIAFYRRHGFVIFDKHPYYIGADRQMDWMMRLDLGDNQQDN